MIPSMTSTDQAPVLLQEDELLKYTDADNESIALGLVNTIFTGQALTFLKILVKRCTRWSPSCFLPALQNVEAAFSCVVS